MKTLKRSPTSPSSSNSSSPPSSSSSLSSSSWIHLRSILFVVNSSSPAYCSSSSSSDRWVFSLKNTLFHSSLVILVILLSISAFSRSDLEEIVAVDRVFSLYYYFLPRLFLSLHFFLSFCVLRWNLRGFGLVNLGFLFKKNGLILFFLWIFFSVFLISFDMDCCLFNV
jgi:hypothetical protein